MSERSLVDRVAFGPVAAVRPWLLAKALYVILAFDVWHTLVGPAWRYGAAGFNVAHFAVLDALPLPTREAYVGMLVVVGAMALAAAALPRTPRALSAAIMVLYTWGWSCSMLDSYQHHYLLSGLLFATCFFPQLTAVDLFGVARAEAPAPAPVSSGKKKKGAAPSAPRPVSPFPHGLVARVRGIGWTLVTTFAGIVYSFTAVSKTEPEWRSGEALRNITHDGATMRAPMELAESLGFDADTVFHLMGTGMIVVQVICALGYLTASLRDASPTDAEREAVDSAYAALRNDVTQSVLAVFVCFGVGIALAVGFDAAVGGGVAIVGTLLAIPASLRTFLFLGARRPRPLAVLASVALGLALSFHVGAEYIGLQIGWFSYYMIALALVALTPAHWLAAISAVATRSARSDEPGLLARTPLLAPVLGMTAAGIAAYAGVEIDLPGAYGASVAVGIVALALGLAALGRPEQRALFGRAAGVLGVAMLACWITMTSGTERYDFYRFGGGDFRRRGEYQRALDDYRLANRYAPPDGVGPDGRPISYRRDDRVQEMEAAIRREGGTPR